MGRLVLTVVVLAVLIVLTVVLTVVVLAVLIVLTVVVVPCFGLCYKRNYPS